MADERLEPADALRQQLDDWLRPIVQALELAEAERQWPQVEQLCKQALQRDGDNWALWQRLANSYEQRSEWAQAETLWRHLTQRFNSRPEPYLALAELQRRRGAPDAARVVLAEAERRVGDSDALRRALGVIDDPWALGDQIPQLGPGAGAAELARAVQLSQQHLDAGRLSEAEAVLEQILQRKPQAGRVHLTLAQLRWRRGELDAVIDQLQPLLAEPATAAALAERRPLTLLLAEALLARGDWSLVEELLSGLLQDPRQLGGPAVALLQAQAAIGRGDDFAAQQLLLQLLQREPGLADAEKLLGELLARQGDWDGAIAALTRALALKPDAADTAALLEQARDQQLWWRGELALRQAAWGEAAEAYRQLLQRRSNHAEALARLDLLASLEAPALVQPEDQAAKGSAAARLTQFAASLDRAEAQLKMLGVVG